MNAMYTDLPEPAIKPCDAYDHLVHGRVESVEIDRLMNRILAVMVVPSFVLGPLLISVVVRTLDDGYEPDRCAVTTRIGEVQVGHGVSGNLGMKVAIAVRPEKVSIAKQRPAVNHNLFTGQVKEIAYLGSYNTYIVATPNGDRLKITEPNGTRTSQLDITWEDEVFFWWDNTDAVVLRETWDYADDRDAFLAWLHRIAGQTLLLNPADVVEWNTDKRYLRELADAGMPVVPTLFLEPGAAWDAWLPAGEHADIVVKPAVSAGWPLGKTCFWTWRTWRSSRSMRCSDP